jgi:hypothetical protein
LSAELHGWTVPRQNIRRQNVQRDKIAEEKTSGEIIARDMISVGQNVRRDKMSGRTKHPKG